MSKSGYGLLNKSVLLVLVFACMVCLTIGVPALRRQERERVLLGGMREL